MTETKPAVGTRVRINTESHTLRAYHGRTGRVVGVDGLVAVALDGLDNLTVSASAWALTPIADDAPMQGPWTAVEGEGVTYHPWTDGTSVGFRIVRHDGQETYVYLAPDADSTRPAVFVCHESTPMPLAEPIADVYELFEPDDDEPGTTVGLCVAERSGDHSDCPDGQHLSCGRCGREFHGDRPEC